MMLPTKWKQWYFYCVECEEKTKAMLYFRTYCPCKESNVRATLDSMECHGVAVPAEDWEKMDAKLPQIIGTINLDFVRKHR